MDQKDVVIHVKDEGQGISRKEISNLFKPFHKTSNKSTGNGKRTGRGLYIVRRIIEAHQGKIWVESEEGKGSIFSLCLPAKVK